MGSYEKIMLSHEMGLIDTAPLSEFEWGQKTSQIISSPFRERLGKIGGCVTHKVLGAITQDQCHNYRLQVISLTNGVFTITKKYG